MENKNNNEEKPKKSWLKALSGLVYEGEDTTNTADAVTTLPEGSGGQSKFSYSDATPASNMPAGVVVGANVITGASVGAGVVVAA